MLLPEAKHAEFLVIDDKALQPLVSQIVDLGVVASKEDECPKHVEVFLCLCAVLGSDSRDELIGTIDERGWSLLRDVFGSPDALAINIDHAIEPAIHLAPP